MKSKLLALAVGAALIAPALAQQSAPVRHSESPPTDWGGWGGKRANSGRQRSRSTRNRSGNEAYKAQRAANRDRRRRGA